LVKAYKRKPTMETLQKFGEAMSPTATDYLSKKFGLEDLIQEKEKELLEKRPGAVTVGNIIELGAELVPPATGYLKLIEDSSSKLYKVIREDKQVKKLILKMLRKF
jgi:translation initiation factor 2B subunit (eIF-2B alpha/beta/delta family)